MNMKTIYYPNAAFNSIYNISADYLKNKGICNIIVDIDNTLSRWASEEPDTRVCDWINNLRKRGFKICILSNSSNKRVKRYCANLDVFYAKNVYKPMKSSFIMAMKLMNSTEHDTCVIGDQIFTDIIGGNKCGLFTILVSPVDKNEFIFTRLMRIIEKRALRKYKSE